MKFPIAFRVFGVINILAFFGLLLQTFILIIGAITPLILPIISVFGTIWFLLSALLWLFKSRSSYTLLYLNSLVAIGMIAGAVFVYKTKSTAPEDILALGLYCGFWVVYALFLIVSLFFKPVNDWVKEGTASKTSRFGFVIFACSLLSGTTLIYLINYFAPSYLSVGFAYERKDEENMTVTYNLGGSTYDFDAIVVKTSSSGLKGFKAVVCPAITPWDCLRSDTVEFKPFGGRVGSDRFYATQDFKVDFKSSVKAQFVTIQFLGVADDFLSYDLNLNLLHSKKYFEEVEASAFVSGGTYISEEEIMDSEGDDEYYDDGAFHQEYEIKEQDQEPIALDNLGKGLIIEKFLELATTDEGAFDPREKITINGHSLGSYNCFKRLFSSYCQPALGALLEQRGEGDADTDYSLNDFVRMTSGLNLITGTSTEPVQNFNYLNPRFIKWTADYLMPHPNEEYLGHTAKEIYDALFRRNVWMLASSYEYLVMNNFDGEVAQYKSLMEGGTYDGRPFHGTYYLFDHFQNINKEQTPFRKMEETVPLKEEYTYFTEEIALGFWMRRRMDGSEEEVWKLVRKVLEEYDSYPFEEGK